MWYRCNVKEYGGSLYSSGEEKTRAGQQAALRQPLLVVQNSCTRVPAVQHSTEACAQQPPVITCQRKPLVQSCGVSGRECSASLLLTTEKTISTSIQVSDSGATLASSRAPASAPDSVNSSTACTSKHATFVAASDFAAGPALAAESGHDGGTRPSTSGRAAAAPSTAATTSSQPALAEVELQHSSRGSHRSSGETDCPFSDPLLHWSDCWAGPGLNRRNCTPSNSHQQQRQDQSQRQQSRDSRGMDVAAPLSGAAHSPRSPRSPHSPTRPYGAWWVGPEQHQTPPAGSMPDRAAASTSAAAGTAATVAGSAAPDSKHDALTRDWISSSCSSIASNPPATPNNIMQLQMQQQPQPVRDPQVQLQPCQQQHQLVHAQQQHEQLPLLSNQPSSALPVSAGAQQQRHMFRWWLVGGVALAALSGGAVVAAYGVMAYMMKAAMVYSFAWKAATGVAAAEGLALGGWGCSSVRKEKAAAKQSAADLARIRSQAAQEVAALKSQLQQREMTHGDEVATLSVANERLTRLAKSLRAEIGNLQSALDRAAAERKSLEAAAALECSRAETSAVVSLAANHTERVVGEVSELRAMLLDLKEDLLGLVSDHAAAGSSQLTAEQSAELAAEAQPDAQLLGSCSGRSSSEIYFPSTASEQAVRSRNEQQEGAVSTFGGGGSADAVLSARPGPLRLKSVRSNIDSALAASIAETLQL